MRYSRPLALLALAACSTSTSGSSAGGSAPDTSVSPPSGITKRVVPSAARKAPETSTSPRTSTLCASCHLRDFDEVTTPLHVGKKPTTCANCHVQTGWHRTRLMHPGWDLTGKHAKAACFYCHEGAPPVFEGTTKLCFGCHEPELKKVTSPDHAGFAKTCEDCHSTDAWKPAKAEQHLEPEPPPIDAGAPAATPSAAPSAHPTPTPTHRPKPRPTPTTIPIPTPTPTELPPDILPNASRRR